MGSAVYERVFKIEAAESVPNPYAISALYPSEMRYKAGDALSFSLTLFGDACDYSADFETAAKEMCRGKLENCIFRACETEYDRVWSDSGAESIPPRDEIRIKFVTPTEILSGKQPVREVAFETFIDSLLGRIGGIIDNYTDAEFVIPYALIAKKPFVAAEYDLEPIDFQTSGQPINGFWGTVRYTGGITRYLPYIDLGSQLHIGKKTTRSCGEYSFEI
jgi:hypothetical protein